MKTYTATWLSHSSMSDFMKCPHSYYLRNVYKDPKTRHKIAIINPALALGQTVHEVLETLATIKVEERLAIPLLETYETVWQKISGKKGGFKSESEEKEYKERGRVMIQRVVDHPGPIGNKAVLLPVLDTSFPLPRFEISKEDELILCGKIDWMEYMPETDSLHIVDFKTGKQEEDPNSLQLAIYCLLVNNLQKRALSKVSYWYLETDDHPKEMPIPDSTAAIERILYIGRMIKEARAQKVFTCIRNGCYTCNPYRAIVNGDAEFVGANDYQDIYIIP